VGLIFLSLPSKYKLEGIEVSTESPKERIKFVTKERFAAAQDKYGIKANEAAQAVIAAAKPIDVLALTYEAHSMPVVTSAVVITEETIGQFLTVL